jgi:hypothetical protein
MKILGLPGRKRSTLEQMRALLARTAGDGDQPIVQEYGFWTSGDSPNPDVRPEAEIAAKSHAGVVVAKSIGTLITMLAIRDFGLRPARCVFVGTPLARYRQENLLPLLESHCEQTPTLFIQQTGDFNGRYADLAPLVARHCRCSSAEIAGGDHLYLDVETIAKIIRSS